MSTPSVPCPACGAPFEKPPRRRTRCRSCGHSIAVRSDGLALFGRSELTEREVLVLETFPALRQLGVTPEAFRAELETRPSAASRASDALWTLWQQALPARPESASWHYLQMALFVSAEGRDPTYLLNARHRTELQRVRTRFPDPPFQVTVEILTSGTSSCAACRTLEGRRYPLEEAIRDQILPVCGCSWITGRLAHPVCRCSYLVDISA